MADTLSPGAETVIEHVGVTERSVGVMDLIVDHLERVALNVKTMSGAQVDLQGRVDALEAAAKPVRYVRFNNQYGCERGNCRGPTVYYCDYCYERFRLGYECRQ